MDQELNVFIDCCAGLDDSIFISVITDLFANNKNFNIIGISASYGKNSIDNSQVNLNHVFKSLGLSNRVDLYKGAVHTVVPTENSPFITYGKRLSDFPISVSYPNITGDILMNKIKSLKNQKVIFISLNNLTCISNLLMQTPQLRGFIDKFICTAGTFDKDINKEMNIFTDPNAANHIFQDPIMKSKIIMFPLNITNNFKVDSEVYKRFKYNGLNDTTKNGYSKTSLLKLIDNNIGKITLHNIPVLLCLVQYLNNINTGYDWNIKEHKLLFKTEEPDQGRIIMLKTVDHKKKIDDILKIKQQHPIVVYGMNYKNAWKHVYELLDTVDNNYTKTQTSFSFTNFKLLSLMIVFLSLLVSFINRIY